VRAAGTPAPFDPGEEAACFLAVFFLGGELCPNVKPEIARQMMPACIAWFIKNNKGTQA
jgi:hypothetical protein